MANDSTNSGVSVVNSNVKGEVVVIALEVRADINNATHSLQQNGNAEVASKLDRLLESLEQDGDKIPQHVRPQVKDDIAALSREAQKPKPDASRMQKILQRLGEGVGTVKSVAEAIAGVTKTLDLLR
jgi:hypothetical protein